MGMQQHPLHTISVEAHTMHSLLSRAVEYTYLCACDRAIFPFVVFHMNLPALEIINYAIK